MREIRKRIYIFTEKYKTTIAIEGYDYEDCAKFLCTLRKRMYTKPSIYWFNFNSLKTERISYQDLYNHIKEYNNNPELLKKLKKLFYVRG